MRKFTPAILPLAVCGLLAAIFAPPAQAQADKTGIALQAGQGRPLTTEELYDLYANRSWIWKDGAGYFQARQRIFLSAVDNGKEKSFAEGTWFLSPWGRLCFRADWRARSGSSEALTCFEHRLSNGDIYQRRLPHGDWYVFRHAVPAADDEAGKLKYGDYVSANLRRYREAVAAATARRRQAAEQGKR